MLFPSFSGGQRDEGVPSTSVLNVLCLSSVRLTQPGPSGSPSPRCFLPPQLPCSLAGRGGEG